MAINGRWMMAAVLAGVVSVGMTQGCNSNKHEASVARMERAGDSLRQTRQDIADARTDVGAANQALTNLTDPNTGTLVEEFKVYGTQVERIQSDSAKLSDRVKNMREKAADYLMTWEKELSTITDKELQTRAMARKDQAAGEFNRVIAAAEAASAAYEPYIRDLTDIRTYLQNDLTPAGLKTLAEATTRAKAQANDLDQSLNMMGQELSSLASRWKAAYAPRR